MSANSEQGHFSWCTTVLVALSLALVDSSGRADGEIEEIEATSIGEKRTTVPDLDARSDFRVADVVSHQYLVVTVDITASGVTPKAATLARGPGKANSAIDDLRVSALRGHVIEAEYSMADPRFVRWQRGSPFELGHDTQVLVTAEAKIYVPLSVLIDKVKVTPSPGSRPGVSAGGEFNPRHMAAQACQASDQARFPACEEFPPPVDGAVMR